MNYSDKLYIVMLVISVVLLISLTRTYIRIVGGV
jgi:hypothetical protein